MSEHRYRRYNACLNVGLWAASLIAPTSVSAAVPLSGYQPLMAIGLTTEKANSLDADFFATNTTRYLSNGLPGLAMGGGHVEIALVDTGAQAHVLTDAAFTAFDFAGAGRVGTSTILVSGVAGSEPVTVHDPIGFYAAPLDALTSTTLPLALNTNAFVGQTNVSVLSAGAGSLLPNVIGSPMLSQYTTVIRVDQPHAVPFAGGTVVSPQVDLLPFGDPSIPTMPRFSPMTMEPGDAFLVPPAFFPSLDLFGLDLSDNPSAPTVTPGAFFLRAELADAGNQLPWEKFFFDTGAQVTVISQATAFMLGYQPSDAEQFIEIQGAGGQVVNAPVITLDSLNLLTNDGGLTLRNVPVAVLDVPDPRDGINPVPGILGTNLFNDRNIVINPEPGNAFLAISDIIVLLAGDLDANGFVDILDLNIVLANWNTAGLADPRADTDASGLVDILDLNLVLTNWNMGTPPPPGAPGVTIPEPTTAALLALAYLGLMPRRRAV